MISPRWVKANPTWTGQDRQSLHIKTHRGHKHAFAVVHVPTWNQGTAQNLSANHATQRPPGLVKT